jgi:heme A synthase
MKMLLVAVVERISARNVVEMVGVVLAALLVAMLLGFAGLSFSD